MLWISTGIVMFPIFLVEGICYFESIVEEVVQVTPMGRLIVSREPDD